MESDDGVNRFPGVFNGFWLDLGSDIYNVFLLHPDT